MNPDKRQTLRNLELLEPGIRPDIVRIGTQGFRHYITGCLVDWMLDKRVPANQIGFALARTRPTLKDLEIIMDLIVSVYSCENNGNIIREAVFSEKLRADRFLPKTGEVIEIRDTENERSIKQKQRAYHMMGIKTEVIEVGE